MLKEAIAHYHELLLNPAIADESQRILDDGAERARPIAEAAADELLGDS